LFIGQKVGLQSCKLEIISNFPLSQNNKSIFVGFRTKVAVMVVRFIMLFIVSSLLMALSAPSTSKATDGDTTKKVLKMFSCPSAATVHPLLLVK
jgi:hypothetical protein